MTSALLPTFQERGRNTLQRLLDAAERTLESDGLEGATVPAIADQLVPKTSPIQSPSPTAIEINDAVARVFEQAAVPGTTPKTNFVVGDFNGDGSEDLAVVVKPNETKLAEVNSEMANWILEDPKKIVLPSSSLAVPISNKPAPVRAESGDKLLAVIHGVGSQGWRSADAKQTFLLKNAAAADMTLQTRKSLRESKDRHKLPPIRGDAIQEAITIGKDVLTPWPISGHFDRMVMGPSAGMSAATASRGWARNCSRR